MCNESEGAFESSSRLMVEWLNQK